MSVGSRPEVGGWPVTGVVAVVVMISRRGVRIEDGNLMSLNRGQRTSYQGVGGGVESGDGVASYVWPLRPASLPSVWLHRGFP